MRDYYCYGPIALILKSIKSELRRRRQQSNLLRQVNFEKAKSIVRANNFAYPIPGVGSLCVHKISDSEDQFGLVQITSEKTIKS